MIISSLFNKTFSPGGPQKTKQEHFFRKKASGKKKRISYCADVFAFSKLILRNNFTLSSFIWHQIATKAIQSKTTLSEMENQCAGDNRTSSSCAAAFKEPIFIHISIQACC